MTTTNRAGTLDVSGVTARYGAETVLDDVALHAERGSTLAVIGPSGSGKTTLMRVIAGFLQPECGTVRLDDRDITAVPAHRRRIGLVAQDGALFPHLTVTQNIAFGLDRRRLGREEVRRRADEMLELVSLTSEHGRRRPDQLSGGQRQRVALARALARGPELILLDEPFSALDSGLRDRTRRAVREVLAETGTTALLVTHDQNEALSFADQVAVLSDGRLRQAAAPREIYSTPADLETAKFLGESVVLEAEASAGVAECVLGQVPLRGPGSQGRVRLLLRPEQLRLVAPGDGVPGTVIDFDYYGHDCAITVEVSGTSELVRVRELDAEPIPPGTPVGLRVEGSGVAFAPESRLRFLT
ncbi:MAG: ABC transporter ATP-binding protein [Nesterenkonia sp.]|uniref:ABC transporter ATP-binding protein n=1 Tax=Nesterenkonia marinintestina TaxID=2979865 RepID=UPI0021C0B7AA|nr:ABC transporter ATP-binding protein [Nesterenkonia sp. GX14115]MDO5493018.1 ABC transporter ATP-binding protein [Nesterenkonia sp.]